MPETRLSVRVKYFSCAVYVFARWVSLAKLIFVICAGEAILSPALKSWVYLLANQWSTGLLLGNNHQASGQALQENRYIRIWVGAAANQARWNCSMTLMTAVYSVFTGVLSKVKP